MRAQLLLVLLLQCNLFASSAKAEGIPTTQAAVCQCSADFVVWSYQGGPAAEKVLTKSMLLRKQLGQQWLGIADPGEWNPRCEIVIHPTRASYLQKVGGGGGSTSGSSLVQFDRGRICIRRIDLLLDSRGELSALAHELTHVVLADRFAGRQPPLWFDEGIALLSDHARKQSLHQRDCQTALRSGTALRLVELLSMKQFASAQQLAPFYGQSHSLVQFLAARDDRSKLVAFVETAMMQGYDAALTQHYAISSVAELERAWRTFAETMPG